jgi:inhibitor of cysteine peptidase
MTTTVRAIGTTARVEARPGDEVIVRLPENPTTGYSWEHADGQEMAASEFDAGGGGAGAGGERVVRLTVRQSPGSATFRLVRSWVPGEPERVFTLILTPPGDPSG